MKCENCNKNHDGSFGSGRFCSSFCARGFSTKAKRKEINEKVSAKHKAKGTQSATHLQTQQVRDKRNQTMLEKYGTLGPPKEAIKKGREQYAANRLNEALTSDFSLLSNARKKIVLLYERGCKCEICKNTEWLGQPITIEMDHIDGNHSNNDKTNFRLLCPNCHSQTPTWRRTKAFLNKQKED